MMRWVAASTSAPPAAENVLSWMNRLAASRRRARSSASSPCRIGRRAKLASNASRGMRWRSRMRVRRQRPNQPMLARSIVDVEQARAGRVRMLELDPLDLLEAAADLVAGNAHLADVLVGLLDVGGELLHALVEAGEILRQLAQFVLDDVRHAPGFRVADHRARGIENGHQRGRRGEPDALFLRVLDQ